MVPSQVITLWPLRINGLAEQRHKVSPCWDRPTFSLADLANSYAVVNEVRLVPFGREAILRLPVVIAIPFVPLLFTMFSVDELLKRVLTTIF